MSFRALRMPLMAVAAAAVLNAACATTGATLGSGVGDAFLDEPPFYAGRDPFSVEDVTLGHMPLVYQPGSSHSSIFDLGRSDAMQTLLARMNAYLDSLGHSVRLAEGGRVSAVSHEATRVPPDVRFGCETDPSGFDDECAVPEGGALGRGRQVMHLAVGRPSPEWVAWAGELMEANGAAATLVITLEVGTYQVRQEGLRGSKVVELGTDHVGRFPWLTSLETPVSVLQLTGALVGPDGKAIRIGAEGLLPRRTPILASAVGAQALITDDDVEALLTARRDDLHGQPLVWREGLRTLVAGLLASGR